MSMLKIAPRARVFGFCLMLVALAGGAMPAVVHAQLGVQPAEQAPAETPELPPDPLNRRSPEGVVFGLLEALAEQDYRRAAQYLDLSALPRIRRGTHGPQLARQLQSVLDQAGQIQSPRQLSNDPEGNLNDGLPADLERFATVRTEVGRRELLLERRDDPELGPIWLVSADTVAEISELAAAVGVGLLERFLPAELADGPRLGGVPLGQWLVLLLLAVAAYLVAWLVIGVAAFLVSRTWRGSQDGYVLRFLRSALVPMRLFAAVWIFSLAAFFLGVSIIARQYFGIAAEVVAWIALAWLAWRAVDTFADFSVEKLTLRGQVSALSALKFFRRGAKVALMLVAGMTVLEALGFDITAGLAALGIGGLALALGAQKTVENLVGSLTLIADRPVRVGDFCRFGDKIGTVEDIGMRSTRIRTLDRTVITIPNGEFSSLQIENFAHRDRFWFHPKLALRYETTADQIRYLLVELRSLLYAHPKVDPESARVRFIGLGATSLDLDVFSYILTTDFDEFLEVQEDLILRIMDVVEQSGTGFAFPSQTVYVAQDQGLAEDKRRLAEAQVRAWKEKGELQLPRFDPERIAALRNSIDYPPPGSALRQPPGEEPSGRP
jgi:MscS family membrane protein